MQRFTAEHHNTYNRDTGVGGADSRWKVMLWEFQTSRLRLIKRVVTDCGARSYCVEHLSEIEKAACSSCCAAVVSLGMYQTDNTLAAKVVDCMKQAGLTVIAHEGGAHSWPVGVRCRALLAGASCVLDSEEDGFEIELQRILTSVLKQKTREVVEKEHNHALMKTFGIEGESHAIEEAFRQALRVASFSDLAVLITGESGTGKELIARAIHQLDPKRRTGPSWQSTAERSARVWLKVSCSVTARGPLQVQIGIERDWFVRQMGECSSWTRLENWEVTYRSSSFGCCKIAES